MEVFLIKALQLILCFAILIVLHEGGHFFFARIFKIRVEKFALFFDPWFKLFKYKPKNSDTTYVLGWLPLGGYVKISGMIDESMDIKQLEAPVQPWEFRAKPAWQRLLVMIGGVLVNFVLAFLIYSAILFTWGEKFIPMEKVTGGFVYNKEAQALGFKNGDIPLGTDATRFDRFDPSIYRSLSQAKEVIVLREGKEVKMALPGNLNMLDMIKKEPKFLAPAIPNLVDSVLPNSSAAKEGLQKGDMVVALNGQSIQTANEYSAIASAMVGQPLKLIVQHGDNTLDTLTLHPDKNNKIGVVWATPQYETATRTYNFFEAIPAGLSHGWKVFTGYISDLKYLFTKDGAESVGSFGAIGNLFPASWDWQRFWELTAFISLMLAFMNILPIPALDGGHVFFLLYEVVTGRKPGDKFMARAETVGMCLLLALMAFAIFNDFRNFVF